jgi:hypothetical protein
MSRVLKKFVAGLICVMLLLSLTACGPKIDMTKGVWDINDDIYVNFRGDKTSGDYEYRSQTVGGSEWIQLISPEGRSAAEAEWSEAVVNIGGDGFFINDPLQPDADYYLTDYRDPSRFEEQGTYPAGSLKYELSKKEEDGFYQLTLKSEFHGKTYIQSYYIKMIFEDTLALYISKDNTEPYITLTKR